VISGVVYAIIPLSIMIAFLFFNTYPAKTFMGDCGSMFIGSFLALFALKTRSTFQFVVIGFVIYFALISVVIQVISYRLTGKRVFPMTPFHHSFEKWGWHENHIIWFYYFLSIIFAYIGISNSYHIYSFMRDIFGVLI
jgi:phospho-N-acetylmuramoyl-pentapeptide-transferase